jgi:membrane protein DedA with SNARE-associated domain
LQELPAAKSIVGVLTIAPLEAGQLEVDGAGFCGSNFMNAFFKVVIWIAAVVAGLIVWNMAPNFRPLVSSLLAAAFACYVLSVIVEVTVKRVISDEQLELRSRLEVLDRKVTAILRDAFERRRLR